MFIAPDIDPVAIRLGTFEVRWYSLAYMAGFLFLRWRLRWTLGRPVDLFLLGAVLAMYLWGRVFYELVYDASYAFAHPLEVLAPGGGGLSFHGAVIGIGLAAWAAAKKWGLPFLTVTDGLATAAPFGIGLGRLANFINQELYGRATDLPWGVVFPAAGPAPRHPSQLYESFLEGWLILAAMLWASRRAPRTGTLTALFLALYALARLTCENFRQPDAALGFVLGGATAGQLLSVLLIAVAGAVYAARPASGAS